MFRKKCASAIIVGIRPTKKERSLQWAEKFIRLLRNGTHSFEIWSDGEICRIFLCSSNKNIVRTIPSIYKCELYLPDRTFPFLNFNEFEVGYLELSSGFYPLETDFNFDPLNVLFGIINGIEAIYQVVFTETSSKKLRDALTSYRGGKNNFYNTELIKELMHKASYPLFEVSIRVALKSEIKNTESFFAIFNNYKVNQIFKVRKIKRFRLKSAINKMTLRCIEKPLILSSLELSYLAHIPGAEIKTKNVEFSEII